jgi:hypothetical protein
VIDGALDYAYSGDRSKPDTYVCTVSGKRRGEGKERTVRVSLAEGVADSRGARERWQKSPDQMLSYYGARVWARRHAPEVIGGLYTPDELNAGLNQMVDITPRNEAPEPEVYDTVTGEVIPPAEAKRKRDEVKKLYRDARTALEANDMEAAVRAQVKAMALAGDDEKIRTSFEELFAPYQGDTPENDPAEQTDSQ